VTGAAPIYGHRRNFWSPPQAHVYNNANISVNDNTLTALTYNTERYDTDFIHSTAANTGRLTCQTPGRYHIWAHHLFAPDADGYRLSGIRLNGATFIVEDMRMAVTTALISTGIHIATEYELVKGDYVEALVQHTAGAALNILSIGNYTPEFGMRLVGVRTAA
jgi:hypothetical protein